MSGSLNLRSYNGVTDIAQGDTASIFSIELLDEKNTTMYNMNSRYGILYLLDINGSVVHSETLMVFDGIIEFNLPGSITHGTYRVKLEFEVEEYLYVYPSKMNYYIRIHESY